MPSATIAVSSICFQTNRLREIFSLMESHSIDAVELSGNIEHVPHDDLVPVLRQKSSSKRIYVHNYFPVPSHTFVLNLAHPDTKERSIKFCRQAIDLCTDLGISLYSVHAGLAFNPEVSDLGKRQSSYPAIGFEESRKLLVASLTELAEYAALKGVRLLVENNVAAKFNCPEGVNRRYHFTDPEESSKLLPLFSHPNLGVLLDFGHLKVSARTLHFDPLRFIELVKDKIEAIHLSDNNGKEDQNLPVREDSWFWPYVPWGRVEYVSLETKLGSMQELKEELEVVQSAVIRYL